MQPLLEIAIPIRSFLSAGGPLLGVLFGLSLVLWSLIIERYTYFVWGHPRHLADIEARWRERSDTTSWFANKIRQAMISEVSLRLNRSLPLIKALIAVCPLLGLLGTVTGMIRVFDVMAYVGSGNARAMADGVSMATIPTMAGMVIALSGLFFSSHLSRRAVLETQRAADCLRGGVSGEHSRGDWRRRAVRIMPTTGSTPGGRGGEDR
jgi:biopolymer transport protein ExbB